MRFQLKMDLKPYPGPRSASAKALAAELRLIANQIEERHEYLSRFQGGVISDEDCVPTGRWFIDE